MGQEHIDCYELKGASKASFRQILQQPNVPAFLLLYFFIFLAFNFFYVAFPVHSIKVLEWSLLELGIFFSINGMIMVFIQGPVLSRISQRFSESTLIIAGTFMLIFGFLVFTQTSLIGIGIGVVLFSVGNGISWPSFLSLLSKTGERRYQGAIQGFASSAGSLASIAGLILGGIFYSLFGINTFWIPGIIMMVIFVLSFGLIRIQRELIKP